MIEEMKEFSGIGETRRTLQYVTLFVIALSGSMKGTAPLPYTASASWDGALMFCSFALSVADRFFLYLCLDAQSFHYYHVWLRD